MLSCRKPTAARLQDFLEAQAKLDLTYSEVGATAGVPPVGYVVDHTRVRLGEGADAFAVATTALGRWEQFRLGWLEAWPPDAPLEVGRVVAVVAWLFGLWSLNACRIVYTVGEDGPVRRQGFAYGTLPEHAQSGEERFTVEWHKADDAVWYDILAMSRPRQLLTRLVYPVARRLQRRFARDSVAAMRRAVVGCKKEA
jgi:uncharacterized protein (UPF0548 family)